MHQTQFLALILTYFGHPSSKYVHEAAPYEKISAKLLLNGNLVPSEETVFHCLIDCLAGSSSMVVVENVIPLFEWIVDRVVKKLNHNVIMKVLELGFLICQRIPCKCSTKSVLKNNARNGRLRQRVLLSIDKVRNPEARFLQAVESLIQSKSTEAVLNLVHSTFAYCSNLESLEIVTYLARKTFKTVVTIASNNHEKLASNNHLNHMARQYISYIRSNHPIALLSNNFDFFLNLFFESSSKVFNQVVLTILLDGKKQRDEYDAELQAQLLADDRKRLTRSNAQVGCPLNFQNCDILCQGEENYKLESISKVSSNTNSLCR